MPFKIIETVEKGQKKLCVIPSFWETNGELRWPKKRLELNKIKDENSRPLQNWSTSKCRVKRSSLLSYEAAIQEMAIMVENSDTEIDTDTVTETINTRDNASINLNAFAAQLNVNQPENQTKPNQSLTPTAKTSTQKLNQTKKSSTARTSTQAPSDVTSATQFVLQYIDESELETISLDTVVDPMVDPHCIECEAQTPLQTQKSTEAYQIENYLKLILENQFNMAQTINVLAENQKKFFKKLASLSVQIDDGFSKSSQTINTDVVTLGESYPNYSEAFKIKPIDSVKDLEEMNSLLSNKKQKFKLINQYYFVCSEADGNGATCAYRILDMFFSREFLCKCSWTGGSRNSNEVKIGLKGYKNVINFFYELIHTWDKSYTEENNEKFFKIVLKNSLKRKLSKNARASTKRLRIKNTKQKNQETNQNSTITRETNQNANDANEDCMIVEIAANEAGIIQEEKEEESLC